MSFKFSSATARLLSQLGQTGRPLSPELAALLHEITALLGALPSDGNLAFLKKPGAWRDRPLPPNPSGNPYYVQLPAVIEIVNLPSATLAALLSDLKPAKDAFDNAVVTIPLQLEARSAVDILTTPSLPPSGATPIPSNRPGDKSAQLSNSTPANASANTSLSQQNAVANQQAQNQLGMSGGQTVGLVSAPLGARSAVDVLTKNRVFDLGPLQARSSVDVLTDNELAGTLLDIKGVLRQFSDAGVPPPNPAASSPDLAKLLQRLLAQIKRICEQNLLVQGDGTRSNPFVIAGGARIYLTASVTLGFPGQTTITLDLLRRIFVGRE